MKLVGKFNVNKITYDDSINEDSKLGRANDKLAKEMIWWEFSIEQNDGLKNMIECFKN